MSRRAEVFVLVAVALTVAVAWFVSRTGSREVEPRPSETRLGRRFLEQQRVEKPLAVAPKVLARDVDEPVVLVVPTGTVRVLVWNAEVGGYGVQSATSFLSFEPSDLLPDPDEAPWPSDTGDGSLDDPWGALAKLDHLHDDLEADEVADLVDDLLDQFPDHPVVDYALVYPIHAIDVNWVTGEGADALADAGVEALLQTEDPLVLHYAAQKLAEAAGGTPVPLPPEALDRLDEVWSNTDAADLRQPLVELGLRAALASEDVIRATTWVTRFEDMLGQAVVCPGLLCEGYTRELHQAQSWLHALRDGRSATWQAALGATARRCAAIHGSPDPALRGEARFGSGRWRWTTWSSSGFLSDCVSSSVPDGPPPPDRQSVELHIVGRSPF
ncbi:MAG: hypothetical protein AAF211_13780 [Myxococcota bacterium]